MTFVKACPVERIFLYRQNTSILKPMITDQLLTYIKDNLQAGYTKADVEVSLRAAGWDAADIAAAFGALAGTPTTPPPAASAPAQRSAQAGSTQSDVDAELARIQAELQKAHKGSPKKTLVETGEQGIIGWMLRKKIASSKNQANSMLIVLAAVFLVLAAWIAFR